MKFSDIPSISILTLFFFPLCVLTGGTSRASTVPSTMSQKTEKTTSDPSGGALQRPKPTNVRAAWL